MWSTLLGAAISVHIRTGDKIIESDLPPISSYVEAVRQRIVARELRAAFLFVSSEDDTAITRFKHAALGASTLRGRIAHVASYDYHRPKLDCGATVAVPADEHAHQKDLRYARTQAMRDAKDNGTCPSLLEHAKRYSEPLALIALANLYLALESSHVICGPKSSNWCLLLRTLSARHSSFEFVGRAF